MSGYAPNPNSDTDSGAASLTSGLLARKGHALPAVDAIAHEGIDIDMAPRKPLRPQRRPVGDHTLARLRPSRSQPRPADADAAIQKSRSANPETIEQAPDAWTIVSPSHQSQEEVPQDATGTYRQSPTPVSVSGALVPTGVRRPSTASQSLSMSGVRATVTFRMPVADFVRLHYAARDLEETCQTVILDALSAYCDANDVELAPKEGAAEEATRLVRAKRRR